MAPSYAPTSIRLAPLKKRGASDRALAGGLTTRIHALVEGLGKLARFVLSEGQAHDITQANTLLRGIVTQAVVADKALYARFTDFRNGRLGLETGQLRN